MKPRTQPSKGSLGSCGSAVSPAVGGKGRAQHCHSPGSEKQLKTWILQQQKSSWSKAYEGEGCFDSSEVADNKLLEYL